MCMDEDMMKTDLDPSRRCYHLAVFKGGENYVMVEVFTRPKDSKIPLNKAFKLMREVYDDVRENIPQIENDPELNEEQKKFRKYLRPYSPEKMEIALNLRK